MQLLLFQTLLAQMHIFTKVRPPRKFQVAGAQLSLYEYSKPMVRGEAQIAPSKEFFFKLLP